MCAKTLCLLLLGAPLLLAPGPAAAQAPDPAELPSPDLDEIIADPRRALVVEAVVGSDGSASVGEAFVTETPPRTHVADPEQMNVQWIDSAGRVLGSRNGWDPRWEFLRGPDGEELVIVPEALGAFDVPFSPSIAAVRVADQETGQVLFEADVESVVLDFCQQNPADPACAAGDADGDGVSDASDNCPVAANPGQGDADGDDVGDACECGDATGDGFVDARDARAIQRCAIGVTACPSLCDATGEGDCDAADARRVQRFAVGALDESDLRCAERSGR